MKHVTLRTVINYLSRFLIMRWAITHCFLYSKQKFPFSPCIFFVDHIFYIQIPNCVSLPCRWRTWCWRGGEPAPKRWQVHSRQSSGMGPLGNDFGKFSMRDLHFVTVKPLWFFLTSILYRIMSTILTSTTRSTRDRDSSGTGRRSMWSWFLKIVNKHPMASGASWGPVLHRYKQCNVTDKRKLWKKTTKKNPVSWSGVRFQNLDKIVFREGSYGALLARLYTSKATKIKAPGPGLRAVRSVWLALPWAIMVMLLCFSLYVYLM
jgi:hypothetical protein